MGTSMALKMRVVFLLAKNWWELILEVKSSDLTYRKQLPKMSQHACQVYDAQRVFYYIYIVVDIAFVISLLFIAPAASHYDEVATDQVSAFSRSIESLVDDVAEVYSIYL